MTIKKGHEIELDIDRTAHHGAGVARKDGFVVFVRGGVPGDRVRARVYRKKRDYAEAAVVDVLTASPARTSPPCPYAGVCGGCQWQHILYPSQLEYKRSHIQDALERIGGLTGVPVRETLPSELVFGYRNKMEFSFSDRRWLLPEELGRDDAAPGFALGLHVPGAFNKIIDVEACLLQHSLGNAILSVVRETARESGLPVYGVKSHTGFWRYVTLRRSVARDEWMVNLVTAEEGIDVLKPLAQDLKARFPRIRTVVNNVNTRKAAIAVGERERVLLGEGFIEDRLGPYTFRISANSFFQTNTPGAETLYGRGGGLRRAYRPGDGPGPLLRHRDHLAAPLGPGRAGHRPGTGRERRGGRRAELRRERGPELPVHSRGCPQDPGRTPGDGGRAGRGSAPGGHAPGCPGRGPGPRVQAGGLRPPATRPPWPGTWPK